MGGAKVPQLLLRERDGGFGQKSGRSPLVEKPRLEDSDKVCERQAGPAPRLLGRWTSGTAEEAIRGQLHSVLNSSLEWASSLYPPE